MKKSLMKQISRRSFLKRVTLTSVGSAVSIGGVVEYALAIEPKWIEVKRVTVRLANLPEAFEGVRIVQVSDFHADDSMTLEELAEVVALINSLKPDFVVITGDYVTRHSSYAFPIAEVLSRIDVPLGCFAVLGNHDYWGQVEEIVEAFNFDTLSLLRNQNRPIDRNGSRIWVAGVDDVLEGKVDFEKTMAGIPANETIILLAHEPDYADEVAGKGTVVLQLSGHSHGGQVRIPFIGAPILPPLGRKYPEGLYRLKGQQIYTNRGLGMVSLAETLPPVRLFCRPEVSLLTLKREVLSGN